MSTETPTRRRARPRRRGFGRAFAIVVAVLVVLGGATAAVSRTQGPRASSVFVDPEAAATASGSRVVFTANQPLAEITDAQVTVEPAAPHTVDTSGRTVGVRFAIPLHDDTEYTVTVTDVVGAGGGPTGEFTTTFTTPPAIVYLLQRSADGDDTIFRTDLTGEQALPVYRDARILDFRQTDDALIVSSEDGDGQAQLDVLPLAALEGIELPATPDDAAPLPLPGEGWLANLQVSEQGDLLGYTWSDADISADSGRESLLFLTDLSDEDAAPQPVEAASSDERIDDYRFVPDSPAILMLNFAGELLLTDPTAGGDPALLGAALTIDDVARGEPLAYIERVEGPEVIDLTDLSELDTLAQPDDALGTAREVAAVPGGGVVATYVALDDEGIPDRQTIARVDEDGTTTPLLEVPMDDGIVQTCISPSGRYAAVLVAPDVIANPYDGYQLPLPETLQTRVIEIDTAAEVVALSGFDITWCRVPPR